MIPAISLDAASSGSNLLRFSVPPAGNLQIKSKAHQKKDGFNSDIFFIALDLHISFYLKYDKIEITKAVREINIGP